MLHILQSIITGYPQANPHGVVSIQWQKQHYRNAEAGAVIQRLSNALLPALEDRRPFSVRLEGPLETGGQYGPYHLAPLWDEASQLLRLEICNDRIYTPDSKPVVTISISASLIAHECADYNSALATHNRRVRNRMYGADKLRDRLMEHNCTVSDSLAAALFDTIAALLHLREQRAASLD